MGGLDDPPRAQQERSAPEEVKFEGRLVPQVWMSWDTESNIYIRNQGHFFWTVLYLGAYAAFLLDLQ